MEEILKQNMGTIEFSKIEIPIELDYDYDKYINSRTCTFEESLMPENRILDKQHYIMSELSKSSSLTYYIEYHNQERIESENYLCVIFLSGRFGINKVAFKYLEKGIDNFLLWEYECIKKYSTKEHAYQQYRIEHISMLFENEMRGISIDDKIQANGIFRSSFYQSKDFKLDASLEYDEYCFYQEVNDSKFNEIRNLSLFLNYLDDYTIDSIRKYLCYIKITISFGTDSRKYFYSKYVYGSLGLINFETDFLKWIKEKSSNPKSNIECTDYRIEDIEINFPVDTSHCPELGLYIWDFQKQ